MSERFVEWEGIPCVIDKDDKVWIMRGPKRVEPESSRSRAAIRSSGWPISEVKAKWLAEPD